MAMSDDRALPVEYLVTTRLGEKGQVTIPKAYRDALGLEAGAPLTLLQLGGGLILIPEHARFQQLCDRVAAVFASRGIQPQEIMDTLPEARQDVVARHYPDLIKPPPTGKQV